MKLIEDAWLSYLRQVLPENAPEVQVIECRRAFYGGAATLFGSIMRSLSPGNGVTENDLQVMFDLEAELKAYSKELSFQTSSLN